MKSVFEFDLDMIPSKEEFNKRYLGTIMTLKIGKEEIPVNCKGANVDGRGIFLYFKDQNQDDYVIFQDSECTLKVVFPETGWFTYGGIPYYWSRQPARQWHRGVCSKNSSIVSLEQVILNSNTNRLDITLPVYIQAMLPREKLLSQVIKSTVGGSLNNHFALFKNKGDVFYLVHGFAIVGTVEGKNIFVDSLSYQDLVDYLKKTNELGEFNVHHR